MSRRQAAAQHADDEGAAGAAARRFGRGEHAAVDAADDEGEQQQRRPDVAQRREALRPRAARAGRQVARPRHADDRDGDHVHGDGEDAGQDAGDEQLADVLLGDQPVDREHRRGRDHDAERAAGGDHAGGEGLRIAVAPHLRIGDLRERRRGRDRRAADRRKAAAGRDGGDAEPAPEMAEEGVRGAEQLAAHAGGGGERAHQQEHRDDGEIVVGHRAHGGVADDLEGGRAADDVGEAADAHQSHRHADRHAQQHQHEQDDETEDGNRVGAHRKDLIRPASLDPGRPAIPDGRSADRCAPRSGAPRRRRRARPAGRTARSAAADRRSAHCRRACSRPCRRAS